MALATGKGLLTVRVNIVEAEPFESVPVSVLLDFGSADFGSVAFTGSAGWGVTPGVLSVF